MSGDDLRTRYDAAWNRLLDLVSQRDKLLHRLDAPIHVAMDITPTRGMVIEFDTVSQRSALDAIDQLGPQISAAMAEVNELRPQLGKPEIIWQKVDLRDI